MASTLLANYANRENRNNFHACTPHHNFSKCLLPQTPSEKQEEEMLDDTLDDPSDVDGESVGLVSELPLTLQGFRHSEEFVLRCYNSMVVMKFLLAYYQL